METAKVGSETSVRRRESSGGKRVEPKVPQSLCFFSLYSLSRQSQRTACGRIPTKL